MNNDDFQNVKLDRTKVVQDGTAVQTRHKINFSKNKMIRVIADRYFSWQITIQIQFLPKCVIINNTLSKSIFKLINWAVEKCFIPARKVLFD